ncbi:hypothetical protein GCM10027289_30500 [Tsukamurella serpentis]
MFDRQVFRDPPVPLTPRQEWNARYEARRSARRARNSLRTARGEYRRYRARIDAAAYLDWPRWKDEYDRTFRRIGVAAPPAEGGPVSGLGG